MVQRYPSSGKPVELERLPPPPSVANAVKLMYVGAAVSTVSLLITLVDLGGLKAAIKKAKPSWSATQVNQYDKSLIIVAVLYGVIGITLWLWMSWASKNGRNWARIVSTVLFCLATLDLVGVFGQPKTAIGLIFPVLTWLVGLGAVFLLWRPDANAFFKPQG